MIDERRLVDTIVAVDAFEPFDDRSAAAKAAFVTMLATLPEPFSRTADAHHVTASAIVVGDRGTLLHRHKQSGDWVGPGGHVDEAEWPAQAVIREVGEETGIVAAHADGVPLLIDLDLHHTPVGHVHYDMRFVLIGAADDPNPPPGESQDVEWLSFDEALERCDESHAAALRQAMAWLAARGA